MLFRSGGVCYWCGGRQEAAGFGGDGVRGETQGLLGSARVKMDTAPPQSGERDREREIEREDNTNHKDLRTQSHSQNKVARERLSNIIKLE